MRVLLISPLRGRDVSGGDISYTEAMVAHPPPGVVYTTYDQALADGTLVERGRRPKRGRMALADVAILASRVVDVGLRRLNVLFREPYHHFSVDPDAFDVVHAHLFAVDQVGSTVPLVTSSGMPLADLYEDRFHWSRRHVKVATLLDTVLARIVRVELPWRPPRRAACTVVWSDHYRDSLVAAGGDPSRVRFATTGLDGKPSAARIGVPTTIGMVATGFEGKGGRVALAALADLRRRGHDVRLVVAGCAPVDHDEDLPKDAVTWLGMVDRARLLDEVLPSIDVLVHPTLCDCGVPYGILEALQRGIPAVVSDYPWLDQRLQGTGVRRVPPLPGAVANALAELLDPEAYPSESQGAIDLWQNQYSMDVLGGQLADAYAAALASKS